MRKQFHYECADSFIFNNISLFLVLHYNLIGIPTAGELESLTGIKWILKYAEVTQRKSAQEFMLAFFSGYADYFCKLISLYGPIMRLMRIRDLK